MIKRHPSISRPPSARRYIPSPDPTTAAIYQKKLMRENRRNNFYHQNRTTEQFADDVENYIQESLMRVKDDFEKFKVYQDAFDYLIQKYQTHSEELLLVKKGYDQVIDDLMTKNNVRNRYRIMVQQSFTSLNNELQKKQAQFDRKKKGFSDLISSVKSTNSDIKNELFELRNKLIKENAEALVTQERANQNQNKLNNIIRKVKKKKDEEKEMTEWIRDNKIRKVQLEEEAKEKQIHLSNVLDSISNSNKEIEKTKSSILNLDERIQDVDNQIQKKNDILVHYSEECDIIAKEIVVINEESQEVQNNMVDLSRKLTILLESAGVSNRQISMIGQEPVKLVALAVSRKKGYMDGIDPDILANL